MEGVFSKHASSLTCKRRLSSSSVYLGLFTCLLAYFITTNDTRNEIGNGNGNENGNENRMSEKGGEEGRGEVGNLIG